MPKLKPYKFRELVAKLRRFDPRFEIYNRGKGSHRMIYHPDILGKPESFPIICHGEGTEIDKCYIRDIIRKFNLPEGTL